MASGVYENFVFLNIEGKIIVYLIDFQIIILNKRICCHSLRTFVKIKKYIFIIVKYNFNSLFVLYTIFTVTLDQFNVSLPNNFFLFTLKNISLKCF